MPFRSGSVKSGASRVIDILFGRDYKLFICEINKEIVGCVASVSNSLHSNICKIDDFFVLPHFRQLKIGRKLCASCYELIDLRKNTKFYSSVEASNIPSKKVFEGLGNTLFRFGIFYSVYKRNGEFKSNYGVRDLGPELLKWGRINYLYSIFNEIVGEEYISFFNKTNRFNFLFPNQNYREIIALLMKRILKVTKHRILLIMDGNEIIGYALNVGNQNQIYLAPSVANNQSIFNCNQALYDFLKPSDCIENYYHLRREAISELGYHGGNTKKIHVLYNVINQSKN